MAEQCWGCGKTSRVTRSAVPFRACTLCQEEGCQPCFFCGYECLRASWPRHKEWHNEQRRLFSLAEELAARHWHCAAAAAPILSPYDDLLSFATSMTLGGAAPPLPPRPPSDVLHAASQYLHAVERISASAGARPLYWAERATSAYALVANTSDSVLQELPRPHWWHDGALQDLSMQVLDARPDFVLAWRMRGEVLSARLGNANWGPAPRNAKQLAEAGRCLQRAATLGHGELAPADKEQLVRQAVECFRAAQAAAAAERAAGEWSHVSSGSSSPTGGGYPAFHGQ